METPEADAPGRIRIEVVFATPESQQLRQLIVPEGTCVDEAIRQSGLASAFPNVNFSSLVAGIWGRVAQRSTILGDGDRVELYRPLRIDPRSARRQLAAAGRTMNEPDEEGEEDA